MMTAQRKPNNVLIIGGSGFLSGTLAKRAISKGDHVWTLTRGRRPLPAQATNLIADRQDPAAFKRVIEGEQKRWDMVIDCIAYTPEDIRQDLSVLEGLAGHLVFVSTDFVYDPPFRQFPQTEETEHYASEGYGHQKRLAEIELIRYDGDLPWTIVRPCHIYGPGSQLGCLPAHSRDAELIDRIKSRATLRLVGGGYFLQQPVLARDLADMLLDLRGNQNTFSQVLNAAGPDVVESRQYYQIIAEILGSQVEIDEIPVGPYLAENPNTSSFLCHRFYDLRKAHNLGVQLPGTPLPQGLQEHVESLLHAK
jgi:nucleoside-diphosphate-sugar epimerase